MGLIARRLGHSLWTVLAAIVVSFILVRAAGDPSRSIAGEGAPREAVQSVRHGLGLDRPVLQQFIDYVLDVVRGDLGTSLRYQASNVSLITDALWQTLLLAVPAMTFALLGGVILGSCAAIWRGRLLDRLLSSAMMITQAVPPFWIGLELIVLFAVHGSLFPAAGNDGSVRALVLPAFALSLFPLGQIARVTRSALSSVLSAEYITALRSRGISRHSLYLKHGLKGAALPIINISGLMAGILIASAVSIEYVFSWPGLGLLTINAVESRDISLVQGIVVVGAVVFVIVNLCVDLIGLAVDSRTRKPLR